MNRYDSFLKNNLPKYLDNKFISEIIICDENGNDVRKIKDAFPSNSKLRLYINEKKLGAFSNKYKCCQLATNDWIALIDSDNFADIDYFKTADEYIKNNTLKNTILAPSIGYPVLDYRVLENTILNKKSLPKIINKHRDKTIVCLNTGNYILNKNLINKVNIKEFDNYNWGVDVILFNLLLFEQLDVNIIVVPGMKYNHVVHSGSFYIQEEKQAKKDLIFVKKRFKYILYDNK